jgi:hypothetical protein
LIYVRFHVDDSKLFYLHRELSLKEECWIPFCMKLVKSVIPHC